MNFYKQHGIAQKLARSDIFERVTLGVICFLAKLRKLNCLAARQVKEGLDIWRKNFKNFCMLLLINS